MNSVRGKGLADVLTTVLLSLLIICQELPHVKLILWLLLGIICISNMRSAIDAVFFFSAFFVGAGFFQNSLLTVKHFHIGFIFFVLAGAVRWKWALSKAKENWKTCWVLIFWILLIALSGVSLLRADEGGRGLRTAGNLFLTVMCAGLVPLFMTPHEAIHGLGFLIFGTCVRGICSALSYFAIPGPYLKEILVFNNHIAFYFTTALFCSLPFIAIAKKRLIKVFFLIMFASLLILTLLTFSRTAYVSFAVGFACFAFLLRSLWRKGFDELKSTLFSVMLCCILGIMILLVKVYFFPVEVPGESTPSVQYLSEIIGVRLKSILHLFFQPGDWKLAFLDKDNFGFFGHHRIAQFKVLWEILQSHWLLGIGLVGRVTDFHSLYLTILGGAGVLGLCSFLFFCYFWMRQLVRSIAPQEAEANVFRVALLACMVSWLVTSVMETFFLQFNIWGVIISGIALSKLSAGNHLGHER